MTWESQDPAAPQDPYASGSQQPPQGQQPPPPDQVPPPGHQPPPGQAPPPGYQPPPGQAPPPGYQPPPGYEQPPPGYEQPQMWMPPPAYPLAPDAYPVNVSYDRTARINRLWGIPILGQGLRFLVLIPHFLVLGLIAIVVALMLLVTWIPVLILGRFPGWGYRWVGGWFAWATRVTAYMRLLTNKYPPFSLSGEDHPMTIRFDEGVRINRLWGIPLIGILVRGVILIPHFILLFVIAILVNILLMFMWVPVLFLGRQADVMYTIVGGYTRWAFRVFSYLLLMVDRYPPFSLGEDDPRL